MSKQYKVFLTEKEKKVVEHALVEWEEKRYMKHDQMWQANICFLIDKVQDAEAISEISNGSRVTGIKDQLVTKVHQEDVAEESFYFSIVSPRDDRTVYNSVDNNDYFKTAAAARKSGNVMKKKYKKEVW